MTNTITPGECSQITGVRGKVGVVGQQVDQVRQDVLGENANLAFCKIRVRMRILVESKETL